MSLFTTLMRRASGHRGWRLKMRTFLESLRIPVPKDATSYHTDGATIIFCIGETGRFTQEVLNDRQISEMKIAGCFGHLGWYL